MSADRFGKWWPCLRKHHKRLHFWLPQARQLHGRLNGTRLFRYFTLCARPMIDVYMLVKEQVLPFDGENNRIRGVSFCECDETIFPEMKELTGVEESGFLAKLEDLVLFEDDVNTEALNSESDVIAFLEDAGEGLADAIRTKIEGKRSFLLFQDRFPVDFMNLDFWDRYYGDPPDVLRIHSAVERLLDWQKREFQDDSGKRFSVERFVAAITCRVDHPVPAEVLVRLKGIVKANCDEHAIYETAIEARDIADLDVWANVTHLDFFMSSWPKEIARVAKEKSWEIEVKEHAFYQRQSDSGTNYHMVCLVVEFSRAPVCTTYLAAVMKSLDVRSRTEIVQLGLETPRSRALLSDLRKIVKLRNVQAAKFGREELPDPLEEMTRLRAEGIPI